MRSGEAAPRLSCLPSTQCVRWRRPDAVEEVRDCSGDPVISPDWRRALPVLPPERFLSDSALLLEAPGSGNTPRAEIRTVTDVLVSGHPANRLARFHRHSHPYTPRRRIVWPTRARPRSPFRRGSAYTDHSTPAFTATQSEFSLIEAANFHAGGGDPSGVLGGSRRRLLLIGGAIPTGRRSHRTHVHANRDLATLPRLDRDRSTGPRHLPRAGPFDGDPEA